MDWKYLFTSFDGRIGRQQCWIGTIVMIIIVLILSFVVMPLLGISMMAGFDPAAGPDAMMSMMRKAAIIQVIMTAILAYPAVALMKKRLNDRNKPSWLIYLFWAPTILSLLMGVTGLNFTVSDVGGVMMPAPSTLSMIVGIATLAIGLWALVELGFLKGTEGPNSYGNDPLAG